MTKYYLMRHAEPVPGHPMDGTRQLTNAGRKQAAQMAKWLTDQIGRVDIVISSPFARAMETAEVMADALGSHVADTRLLEPDAEPAEMWKDVQRLAQLSRVVLIVGHDPSINKFLAWLISGGATRFEHGSIAHVNVKEREGLTPQVIAKLHWLVDPKLVEKDEDEEELKEAARGFVAALAEMV